MRLEHLFEGMNPNPATQQGFRRHIIRSYVPGPGVPTGVVVRLLQCGAMVTWSSSSVRFIRLFTSALVLASEVLLLRCMVFTS